MWSVLLTVFFVFLFSPAAQKHQLSYCGCFLKYSHKERLWKWQCCALYFLSCVDFHIKTAKLGRQRMPPQLQATQSSFVFWLFSSSYININKYFVGETETSVFPGSNQVQFILCSVIKACFCEKSKPIPRQRRINYDAIFNLQRTFQQCEPFETCYSFAFLSQ